MKKPQGVSDETWNELLKSSIFNRLPPDTEFLVKVENEFKINSWEKYETYHFDIEDNFGNLFNVTWNKDTHNEGENSNYSIPEFEITDSEGEFIDSESEEFETIVNLIKQNKTI